MVLVIMQAATQGKDRAAVAVSEAIKLYFTYRSFSLFVLDSHTTN